MTRLVVDASVAIKWLLPEENSEEAALLLSGKWSLQAPDLVWAEAGNILWKKWKREELASETVPELITDLKRFPLRIYPSEPLCHLAWDIARRFNRSFYDSLYIALSVSASCPLVTADLRLYNALQGVTPEINLLWVGDIT